MNYIQTHVCGRYITSFEFTSDTEGKFTPELCELAPYLEGVIIKADADYDVANTALLLLEKIEDNIHPFVTLKVSEDLMSHLDVETLTVRRYKTPYQVRREWSDCKMALTQQGFDLNAIVGLASRPYVKFVEGEPKITWDLKVIDCSRISHEYVDMAQLSEDDLELSFGDEDYDDEEGDLFCED